MNLDSLLTKKLADSRFQNFARADATDIGLTKLTSTPATDIGSPKLTSTRATDIGSTKSTRSGPTDIVGVTAAQISVIFEQLEF